MALTVAPRSHTPVPCCPSARCSPGPGVSGALPPAGTWRPGTSGARERFQVTAAGPDPAHSRGASVLPPPALPLQPRGGGGPTSPHEGQPQAGSLRGRTQAPGGASGGAPIPPTDAPQLCPHGLAPETCCSPGQPRWARTAGPSPKAAPARPPSRSGLPMLPYSRGHSELDTHPKGPAAPDPFHRVLLQARRSPGARRRSQLLRAQEPRPQLGTGCPVPRRTHRGRARLCPTHSSGVPVPGQPGRGSERRCRCRRAPGPAPRYRKKRREAISFQNVSCCAGQPAPGRRQLPPAPLPGREAGTPPALPRSPPHGGSGAQPLPSREWWS
ncbi:basic salivary proline-rich protein 2-like [Melanerpes formicivorus]|uniref:basic salivary proline-rich protein 2-like n=1 Tax=Melanerpes formicivorus TaxID=211600 RepID=UPI00358EA275